VTTCTPREGEATTRTVTLSTGAAPPAPTSLAVSWVEGLPRLVWSQPASATPIAFYRIYRDGAGRYDKTITRDPGYSDPRPEPGTAHEYRVTAVDENFNESAPSDPVTLTPLS
jgi:fibronectin type 3 domain-containing protein